MDSASLVASVSSRAFSPKSTVCSLCVLFFRLTVEVGVSEPYIARAGTQYFLRTKHSWPVAMPASVRCRLSAIGGS